MMKTFDLIVIGAGMAAVSAANKCASAGWLVAIVDELPYGGTCALRGCDPKKILRRAAELVDGARLMRGKGINDESLRIEWANLVAFKRSFTEKVPDQIENGLQENGVVTYHGEAQFIDTDTIDVAGERLKGRHILIATGAKPRPVEVQGGEHLLDNAEFMELNALPRRILFVGGGYISFEFAHMAARAGSEVVILDRGTRPLKAFDPELVDKLVVRSAAAGIDIQLDTILQSIDKSANGFVVHGKQNNADRQWPVDLVVHGAGRTPAIDRLELEAANIEHGSKGIVVNEYLQSVSNPAICAAGDAADTPGMPLTPVAVFEGKVAASNMLKGNEQVPDYRGVPSVVFSIPELARVGMLEAEAEAQGLDFRAQFTDTGSWFSNLRVGENCAAVKILTDNSTDKILGAHMLGPEYAEVVNFFGLAIKLGLKASDLKKMTAAYPTIGSDIGSML